MDGYNRVMFFVLVVYDDIIKKYKTFSLLKLEK